MSTVILCTYIYQFPCLPGTSQNQNLQRKRFQITSCKVKKAQNEHTPKHNVHKYLKDRKLLRKKQNTHPKRPAKDESNHAPSVRCECLLRQLQRLGNPRQHGHNGAVVHPASWRTANCWSRLYLSIPRIFNDASMSKITIVWKVHIRNQKLLLNF